MTSALHRWIERILAFGGLVYWLLSTYLGLALAGALMTTLTAMSQVRVLGTLGLVVASFAAREAHRRRSSLARFAHAGMIGTALLTLGTCGELVEFAPQYVLTIHRGVQIEYADEGVRAALPDIRSVIDQVYARSGLPEPSSPLRMRFMKNTGGRWFQVGDWSDARDGGADVVLTTDRGGTRGASFVVEGSFLLAQKLGRRAQTRTPQGAVNGFAYWTMLGVEPQAAWASAWLVGRSRSKCVLLERVRLDDPRSDEMTVWSPGRQDALHLDAAPFIDADLTGGAEAVRTLFDQAVKLSAAEWRALVEQHCARS